MQNNNEVLIISAEASSNLYAQRLLELSASEEANIHYWGVGNQDMIDLGFEALGRAEDMAVMGFQEVLKHYPFIKGIYNNILEQVDKRQTKVALLMDYAEFNMKLAGDLKKRGVKVLFYI
ncbi:MAG: lipid-A-disaccharide synthase, partial [Bdellovibrionota bacterium]|nr:lipid-A-disaccharide synthase [Bdellovibrionota bacterium]